jgi:hypothetical protein
MLTRESFLALAPDQQAAIAWRMWGNLHNRSGYNPLGGEANDVYMCALMIGSALLELDDGRFVVWDTGTKVVAVVAACHGGNERYYPVAVRLTEESIALVK